MKYVFTNVKVNTKTPRYAEEITSFLVNSVGSEILTVMMPKYLGAINNMINAVIPKNKIEMIVNKIVYNLDKKVHGHITITKKVSNGVEVLAELSFIEVNDMWMEDGREEYGIKLKNIALHEKEKWLRQIHEKGGES